MMMIYGINRQTHVTGSEINKHRRWSVREIKEKKNKKQTQEAED
jgi:hypothetical protein